MIVLERLEASGVGLDGPEAVLEALGVSVGDAMVEP
jgi:hypothetical protein